MVNTARAYVISFDVLQSCAGAGSTDRRTHGRAKTQAHTETVESASPELEMEVGGLEL